MCIIFLGRNQSGIFIFFNRDEHLGRESVKLEKINLNDFKSDHYQHHKLSNDILYCKDCITNGTFFAMNDVNYNFCFLLNHDFLDNVIRKKRRGIIPLLFCSMEAKNKDEFDSITINEFIKHLKIKENEYKGFNLVFGNLKYEKVFYYTNNILNSNKLEFPLDFSLKIDEKGQFPVYGNSNDYLNEPDGKVSYGIDCIKKIIDETTSKCDEPINDFYEKVINSVMFNDELIYKSNEEKIKYEIFLEEFMAIKKINLSNKYFANVYEENDIDNYFANSIFVKTERNNIITCYGNRQSYFIQKTNENIIIREKFAKINRISIKDYEKVNNKKVNLAKFDKYIPESIYTLENYEEYRNKYEEIIIKIHDKN